jgi:Protein of unknown function (DUF3078)
MVKRLFCIIFISGFYLTSFSQNPISDSLIVVEDKRLIDSIEYELIQDTIRNVLGVTEDQIDDTISITDTVPSELTFQKKMDLQDSILFEELDTAHYIIYKLDKILAEDSLVFSDSIKQAINKLTDFIQNQNISPVIEYLESGIEDSSLFKMNEYVFDAVQYLIKSIPEDSVKILFTNSKNDSVLIAVKESELDSALFRLYDNRGEFAVLWIKKNKQNNIDLSLEDGFYLEKIKRRNYVAALVDVHMVEPILRNVEMVNIVIPIWKFGGMADIKFNQGYVSPSWAAGGENSLSALSTLKYSADYTYGKKRDLDTDVEYRLGYFQSGDSELEKNFDKFEINVKYGRVAFNNWYYSGLFNFKTQFFKGYDYSKDTPIEVSNFLSPASVVFSLGLDYKPSRKLTILFSPFTSKYTIVADTVKYDQTRFGVGNDEFIKKEFGAFIKAISKIKFREIITLENKVNFFTNYRENPQNIDVDLEVNLILKITEYINISFNGHFIYDDDVEIPVIEDGVEIGKTKGPQFKELVGIGFTYSF